MNAGLRILIAAGRDIGFGGWVLTMHSNQAKS